MWNKPGVVILIIGLGLLIASLFADPLRIGDDVGFGRQQTLGTAVGVVIIVVGLIFTFRMKQPRE